MTKVKYDYKKTVKEGLRSLALFLLPVLVDRFIVSFPEYAQLTIGGLLVAGRDWLKYRLGYVVL